MDKTNEIFKDILTKNHNIQKLRDMVYTELLEKNLLEIKQLEEENIKNSIKLSRLQEKNVELKCYLKL